MFAKHKYLQWVIILFLVGIANGFAGGWEQISELPTWRRGRAAAAVKGKIYLTGGFDHHKNLGGGALPFQRWMSIINNGDCCERHHLSLRRLVRQQKQHIFADR